MLPYEFDLRFAKDRHGDAWYLFFLYDDPCLRTGKGGAFVYVVGLIRRSICSDRLARADSEE